VSQVASDSLSSKRCQDKILEKKKVVVVGGHVEANCALFADDSRMEVPRQANFALFLFIFTLSL